MNCTQFINLLQRTEDNFRICSTSENKARSLYKGRSGNFFAFELWSRECLQSFFLSREKLCCKHFWDENCREIYLIL